MMSWPLEDLTKFSNDFVLIEDKKGSADIIEQANLDPKKIDHQKTINDQKLNKNFEPAKQKSNLLGPHPTSRPNYKSSHSSNTNLSTQWQDSAILR